MDEMTNILFQQRNIVLNSGILSDFKIECDALTTEDWECIAYLISKKFKFKKAIGVPTGGIKLALKLEKYKDSKQETILIVDDVLTTGESMETMKMTLFSREVKMTLFSREDLSKIKGVVLFARGKCQKWITPIFQMNF